MKAFVRQYDFGEIEPLLIKGALVAKDPPAFESVPGITEEEAFAIRNEVLHKWKQPKLLYFTIILCSIGAAVQGWDQTGSNGANLSFPDALQIPVENPFTVPYTFKNGQHFPANSVNPYAATNQWLQGLVNAAPYIASAFMSVSPCAEWHQ